MKFYILFFSIIFTITFFVYYLMFDNKLKKEKYTKISELVLLVKVFKLDKKKMNYKSCLNGVALINAFIISITIVLLSALKIKIYLSLPLAFIFMVILILGMYYAYGKILQKKWGLKDGI